MPNEYSKLKVEYSGAAEPRFRRVVSHSSGHRRASFPIRETNQLPVT